MGQKKVLKLELKGKAHDKHMRHCKILRGMITLRPVFLVKTQTRCFSNASILATCYWRLEVDKEKRSRQTADPT
jgi:hypothetical protein